MSLTKVTYSMINGASVNVLDFGADPTGVQDSTAAIRAAIAAALASGTSLSTEVFFPAGTYLFSDTLDVSNSRQLSLRGQTVSFGGGIKTKLVYTGTASPAIKMYDVYSFEIDRLGVLYNNASFTGNLIESDWDASNLDSQFVYFHDSFFGSISAANSAANLISWNRVVLSRIERCQLNDAVNAINLGVGAGDYCNTILISYNTFNGISGRAIVVSASLDNIEINGNNFQQSSTGLANAYTQAFGTIVTSLKITNNSLQDIFTNGATAFAGIISQGCEITGNYLWIPDVGRTDNIIFDIAGGEGYQFSGNFFRGNTFVKFSQPNIKNVRIVANYIDVSTLVVNPDNAAIAFQGTTGNYLVGTVSEAGLATGNVVNTGIGLYQSGKLESQINADANAYFSKASGYSSGAYVNFYVNNSAVGGIATDGSSTRFSTTPGVFVGSGAGSPEGVVTASVGSIYTRTNGGAGTTLYVKESGAGNTGWSAK
jgi:hypothetical protein